MKGKSNESKRRVRTGVSSSGKQGPDEPGSGYGKDSESVSSGTGQELEQRAERQEQRSDADELGGRQGVEVNEGPEDVGTRTECREGGVEAGGEPSWFHAQDPHASGEGEVESDPGGDEAPEGETYPGLESYSGVEAINPNRVKHAAPKNIHQLAKFQFKKGVSGNPKGKPKGVYDKFSKTKLQQMLDIMGQDAHKIIRKAIKKALDDTDKDQAQMLKLLIDRLVPATKAVEVTGLGGRELALKVLVEGIETHNQINQLDIADAKLIN